MLFDKKRSNLQAERDLYLAILLWLLSLRLALRRVERDLARQKQK